MVGNVTQSIGRSYGGRHRCWILIIVLCACIQQDEGVEHTLRACGRELELAKLVKEGVSQLGIGGNSILAEGIESAKSLY